MSDDANEVVQLILRERQGRDRGWWDQMRDTYAEDSVVDCRTAPGESARQKRFKLGRCRSCRGTVRQDPSGP